MRTTSLISASELKKLITIQKKIISNDELLRLIINSFDDKNITYITERYTLTANAIINEREEEKEKIKSLIDNIEKTILDADISDEERKKILMGVLGQTDKKPKKVKYRAIINQNGLKETLEWSGRGKKPLFFRELSEEELEKYRVNPPER